MSLVTRNALLRAHAVVLLLLCSTFLVACGPGSDTSVDSRNSAGETGATRTEGRTSDQSRPPTITESDTVQRRLDAACIRVQSAIYDTYTLDVGCEWLWLKVNDTRASLVLHVPIDEYRRVNISADDVDRIANDALSAVDTGNKSFEKAVQPGLILEK